MALIWRYYVGMVAEKPDRNRVKMRIGITVKYTPRPESCASVPAMISGISPFSALSSVC